jgi:hypothetical protein
MLVENDVPKPDRSSSERRDRHQQDKRILGYVVQCDGAQADWRPLPIATITT